MSSTKLAEISTHQTPCTGHSHHAGVSIIKSKFDLNLKFKPFDNTQTAPNAVLNVENPSVYDSDTINIKGRPGTRSKDEIEIESDTQAIAMASLSGTARDAITHLQAPPRCWT